MYFVFNKSHMFVRLNLVANLMYIIYVNNTLPLATDLYMKLHTELGRLCPYFQQTETKQDDEKIRLFDFLAKNLMPYAAKQL